MHPLIARAGFAVVLMTVGAGALPAYATSAATAPPTTTLWFPAAQQNAVDCDLLPDVSNGPVLVVTAPTPGSTLAAGTLTIQGAALDCAADVGSGVDRVSVFLGRRDAGGIHLGDATLRGPNPIRVLPADQYSSVGWTLMTAVPLKAGQANELYVYAHSTVNSLETTVVLPIMGEKSGTVSPAPPPMPVIGEESPAPSDRGPAPPAQSGAAVQPAPPTQGEAMPEGSDVPPAPAVEASEE